MVDQGKLVEGKVKEGVDFVFDENPELANVVYDNLIPKGYTRLYRVREIGEKPTYDPKGNWIYSSEQIKEREKYFGRWFSKDKTDIDWYKKDRSKKEDFSDVEVVYVDIPTNELNKYKEYDKTLSRKAEDEFVLPVELANSAKNINNLKQQAQQLYSQYLDSVFPDSKVKDIAYRGDKSKQINGVIQFLKGERKDLLFLSNNKEVAKNRLYHSDFSEFIYKKDEFGNLTMTTEYEPDELKGLVRGPKNFIAAVVNIQKPLVKNAKNQPYTDYKIDGKSEYETIKDAKEKIRNQENDSLIVENVLEGDVGRLPSTNIGLSKPEQIHILGSKQDIEGFKSFVQQQKAAPLSPDELALGLYSIAYNSGVSEQEFMNRINRDGNLSVFGVGGQVGGQQVFNQTVPVQQVSVEQERKLKNVAYEHFGLQGYLDYITDEDKYNVPWVKSFVGEAMIVFAGSDATREQLDKEKQKITDRVKEKERKVEQIYRQYLEQGGDVNSLKQFRHYVESEQYVLVDESGMTQTGLDTNLSQKIQNLMQEKYPEIKLDITNEPVFQKETEAINERIIGQANIKAMTVLIDAVNQKQDTLPHEYAHHYIAWFRNTPMVKQAISQWGSEEALVQAIGEQVVAQKGEALNWWKRFVRLILSMFGKVSNKDRENIKNMLTNAFLEGKDLQTGKVGISRERSRELAGKTKDENVNTFLDEVKNTRLSADNAIFASRLKNLDTLTKGIKMEEMSNISGAARFDAFNNKVYVSNAESLLSDTIAFENVVLEEIMVGAAQNGLKIGQLTIPFVDNLLKELRKRNQWQKERNMGLDFYEESYLENTNNFVSAYLKADKQFVSWVKSMEPNSKALQSIIAKEIAESMFQANEKYFTAKLEKYFNEIGNATKAIAPGLVKDANPITNNLQDLREDYAAVQKKYGNEFTEKDIQKNPEKYATVLKTIEMVNKNYGGNVLKILKDGETRKIKVDLKEMERLNKEAKKEKTKNNKKQNNAEFGSETKTRMVDSIPELEFLSEDEKRIAEDMLQSGEFQIFCGL